MATSRANLDLTQYVKVNSQQGSVTLQSLRDTVRVVFSDVKPVRDNTVFHTLGDKDNPLQIENISTDVWVLSMTDTANLIITETSSTIDVNVGSPNPLPVTVNNFPETPRDFYTEVSKGNVIGHESVAFRGLNSDIDSANEENLWTFGGIMVYATAGEQWEILSNDTSDNATGNGAQMVKLDYLDDNYIPQEEIITLNGTTPVQTVATNMFRAISLAVISVGSTGHNEGDLTVRVSGGGNPRIGVIATGNIDLHGFYTVPAGKSAYLIYAHTGVGKNKDVNMLIRYSQGSTGILYTSVFSEVFQNTAVFDVKSPVGPIEEKSDIDFLVSTENNNTDATAYVQLLLVDNE